MEISKKYQEDYGWYFDYLRKTTEKKDVSTYIKQLLRECKPHYMQLSDGELAITCIGGGSGDADVEIIDELHRLGFRTNITYVDPSELMYNLFYARLSDKGFEDSLKKAIIKPFERAHFIPKSDLILCINAIYYLNGIDTPSGARRILSKMYKKLKKGGIAVIVVQSKESPHYALRCKANRALGCRRREIDGSYLYNVLSDLGIPAMLDTVTSRLDVTRVFRHNGRAGSIKLDSINKNILSLALRVDWDDLPPAAKRELLSEIEKNTVVEGNKRYMILKYNIIVFYKPIRGYSPPHNPFEEIDVVDDNDMIVGRTTRFIAHMKGVLHREVGLLLFSSNGKLIVQQRAADGRYDFSVSGHIPAGSSPDESIVREAFEELGLKLSQDDINFVFKKEIASISPPKTNRRIFYLYTLSRPVESKELLPGPEVGNILEMDIDKLIDMANRSPDRFSKGFLTILREYKRLIDGHRDLVVIKIGGSVFNPKHQSDSKVNTRLLKRIFLVIKRYWPYMRFVLVFGGGRIGHSLTIRTKKTNDLIAYTRNYIEYETMIRRIIKVMLNSGLPAYPMRVSSLVFDRVDEKQISKAAEEAIEHGFIPVFYADWLKTHDGFYVLSSDEIVRHLANGMKANKAIFLTDVDGLYHGRKLVKQISVTELLSVPTRPVKDATGGMAKKLEEITNIKVPVFIINGNHPGRLEDILLDKPAKGTYIKPK